MDLKGSLVDTSLRIYPAKDLIDFLETLPVEDYLPANIKKFNKNEPKSKINLREVKVFKTQLNDLDIENLEKIKNHVKSKVKDSAKCEFKEKDDSEKKDKPNEQKVNSHDSNDEDNEDSSKNDEKNSKDESKKDVLYLTTLDIDWLYDHIKTRKAKGEKDLPYLHVLLEGANIEMPENRIIKRNPVLEARCVKLRAQQEAREYRKMTRGVDNVRMRFPDDSISYQLKQVNRHLIAIGQFILSIFAGFLFGFRGVEWMVGNLDFGFRLLLGVMCALVIALAEIYFLAKKLNEELSIPETTQIGGPPKFVDEEKYGHNNSTRDELIKKPHQD